MVPKVQSFQYQGVEDFSPAPWRKAMTTEILPVISVPRVPKPLLVFSVGAFGGVAPTLLRIAVDLSQQNKPLKEINGSVLLGMAIFAVLGGAVAAIWNEIDLKKVFYIGLGLPSLITVVTTTATTPQPTADTQLSAKSSLVAALSWQPGWPQNVDSGSGKLRVVLPPEVGYDGAVATFYLADNTSVIAPVKPGVVIAIPDRSTAVAVTSPVAQSERIRIQAPSSSMVIKFTAQKDPLYGFLYAVGAHSKPFKLIASSVTSNNFGPRDNTPVKYSAQAMAPPVVVAHSS
jgi:hypothetical protein